MSIYSSGGPYVPSSFLPFSWFSIPYVDTNGDGITDILWGNINLLDPNLLPLDGLAIWTIDGPTIENGAFLPISPAPSTLEDDWLPVSFKSLDFNGDGKSDIAWQNVEDGRKAIWLLDGVNFEESFIQSAPDSSPEWFAYLAYEIVDYDFETLINTTDDLGVARDLDFNGDGKTDIFWDNEGTGEKAIWIMDGTTIQDGAFLQSSPDSTSGWDFSFADFSGDGKTDIFWVDSITGEKAIWIMDGPNIADGAFLQSSPDGTSGWDFSFADFNSDGKEDIFWSKEGSDNAIWIMDGPNIADGSFLQSSPDGTSGWDLSFTDFNGDGKEDIFWSKAGSDNAIWMLDGPNIADGSFLQSSPDGSNSANWDYAFGDFNGDSKTDIFWLEKGGEQAAVWIMDGDVITDGSFLQANPTGTNSAAWQFYLTDFTGDGKSDIYWKNGISNETAIWILDGPQLVDGAFLQNDPGAYPFPLPTVG